MRFTATNEVAVGFVVHTAPVLVVWYGVHEILAGRLTVGALTQFLLYLGMFYSPLQRLSDLSVVLSNALAAIDRIFEYFDTQPHVAEHAKPHAPGGMSGPSSSSTRASSATTPMRPF